MDSNCCLKDMNKLLIVLGCLFFFISCISREARTLIVDQTIDCNSISDNFVSDLVDSITFLPLDDCDEGMLTGVDKVRIVDEYIYLGDFHTNKILVFDKEGEYQYKIDAKGPGPAEYVSIKSFTVDSNYIYIVDNWSQRMLLYNRINGSFVKSMKLPFIAWDMEVLSDGNLIFAFVPVGNGKLTHVQPPFRLFVTDSCLNIKNMMLEYTENETDPLGQKLYFTRNGKEIIFGSYLFDGYTIVSSDSIPQLRHVRTMFHNSLTEHLPVHVDEINEYQCLSSTPFVCSRYVYLSFSHGGRMKYGIYDTVSQKISFNSRTDGYKSLMPIIASENGCLIGRLSNYNSYNYMVNKGFNRGNEAVESTLKDGGTVLVFYHLEK